MAPLILPQYTLAVSAVTVGALKGRSTKPLEAIFGRREARRSGAEVKTRAKWAACRREAQEIAWREGGARAHALKEE